MAEASLPLKHAIIEFYRGELRRRYLLANVRKFEQFDDVSDEHVEALRTYFLDHIYPPTKDRDRLDDAINRMGDVMKSPRRLMPLIGIGFSSMWKLGTSIPSAISAGNATLDAYLEARKLESIMFDAAVDLKLDIKDGKNRTKMIAIMAEVPQEDVGRLIQDIMKLFHALSNTKMLQTAVDFLERCTAVMVSKPDLYDSSEVEGITLGRLLVQGGLDLFLELERDQFPRIIEGIEKIEWDWYERVCEEAGGK